ncbi:hypothetical protein KFK09_014503 [Dendrobium nobile]|uniref:Uncharacterized protein n=1 Tax=Dendrobium nobile TaxID=94219 RepID=A0A8T3B428_DENNO|nr:hypothetical protein KFK09_014503 [Dendrobium nobile]
MPTKGVCLRIERILNIFFWNGSGSNSKIHWKNWKGCCGIKKKGGLGCKDMTNLAWVFSLKLWFNFRSNVSLWANFMKDKHCGGNHPTLSCYSKGNSKVWQRICSVKWLMEPLLAWGLGNGDIFFWQDRWVNGESIDSLLNTVSNSKMKVNYFFSANGWDVEKLYAFIPDNIIQIIIKIPFDGNVRDVLLFSGSKDGSFSIKNAWNSFRTKKGIIRNHLGFLISGFAGPAVVEDMHMVVLMSVMSGIKFCKKV